MKLGRTIWLWRWGLTALFSMLLALSAIDLYGQVNRAQPADVIVILGSRVYPGGVPGPALTRRAQHAVALYQQGFAPIILCSGGVGASPPAEAVAACHLAETLGAPPNALLREDQSHSTEENALYTAALLRANGWRTAIIVSDGYRLASAVCSALFAKQIGWTRGLGGPVVEWGVLPLISR
jgi:uncharacterized SAM-binding protein YcdF (DUF218 family)